MNYNDYYFHGTSNLGNYQSIKTIIQILESGFIYSKNMQKKYYGEEPKNVFKGFNGNDYISLCKYSSSYNYTAFNLFIKDKVFLVLNNNLDVIKPIFIKKNISSFSKDDYAKYCLNEKQVYTDLIDEVMVKDKISIKDIVAINFPVHNIIESYKNGNYIILTNNCADYKMLQNELKDINYNIKLVDLIENNDKIEDHYEENCKLLKKVY